MDDLSFTTRKNETTLISGYLLTRAQTIPDHYQIFPPKHLSYPKSLLTQPLEPSAFDSKAVISKCLETTAGVTSVEQSIVQKRGWNS